MSEGLASEAFGPYLVYEQIGAGGMASVHRAEVEGIEGFRREVALKRMLPHVAESADMVKAFVREAHLASYLRHANVPSTYELGQVGNVYFIAMELITGPNLRMILKHCARTTGAMPVPVALNILNQMCDALDYAHNLCDDSGRPLGIIHRDVSPSNIIVSEGGVVKLIDFGIAKVQAAGMQTMSGTIKGKFGYMAPEYIGGSIDARADLFALGVVAHELLTNRPLFSSSDDMETLRRVRRMDIPPPSSCNKQVPPEVDDIVMTALARDPEKRWQQATALRTAMTTVTKRLGLTIPNSKTKDWIDWAFAQGLPEGARQDDDEDDDAPEIAVEHATGSASETQQPTVMLQSRPQIAGEREDERTLPPDASARHTQMMVSERAPRASQPPPPRAGRASNPPPYGEPQPSSPRSRGPSMPPPYGASGSNPPHGEPRRPSGPSMPPPYGEPRRPSGPSMPPPYGEPRRPSGPSMPPPYGEPRPQSSPSLSPPPYEQPKPQSSPSLSPPPYDSKPHGSPSLLPPSHTEPPRPSGSPHAEAPQRPSQPSNQPPYGMQPRATQAASPPPMQVAELAAAAARANAARHDALVPTPSRLSDDIIPTMFKSSSPRIVPASSNDGPIRATPRANATGPNPELRQSYPQLHNTDPLVDGPLGASSQDGLPRERARPSDPSFVAGMRGVPAPISQAPAVAPHSEGSTLVTVILVLLAAIVAAVTVYFVLPLLS